MKGEIKMKCPVCGCDSHMERDGQDLEFIDEILIGAFYFWCQNCDSRFQLTERYNVSMIDSEMTTLDECHENNFGEAENYD
jgi:C4-type Zn-finger protein